jgi:hypothetical protein
MVSFGGSTLRFLPKGGHAWTAIHAVKGDNLYRVSGDDSGRLLAAWETEPVFHLFVPGKKQDVTFPKPACPASPDVRSCHLEEVFFAESGREAVVVMSGIHGGSLGVTLAFLVSLERPGEPTLIYRQDGYRLYLSRKGGIFVVPQTTQRTCDHGGCWPIASIVAWQVAGKQAAQKTLHAAEKDEMHSASLVWGSDDTRVLIDVGLSGRFHGELRWRFGDSKPDWRVIPALLPSHDFEQRLFGEELIDLRQGAAGTLELRRTGVDGVERLTTLTPLPDHDIDVAPDSTVHGLGLRAEGSFWLHWGNHLVLLPRDGPPRHVDLEPMLKRRNEWAGVAIYVAEPESLWVGIEIGAGRDFARLNFAELEKSAKPWPDPAKDAAGAQPR